MLEGETAVRERSCLKGARETDLNATQRKAEASATRRRGSQGRPPTSASTGRWAIQPSRSSTPPRGRTSWAAPRACVSTRCTVAGCVCTARFPPTYYAPRSPNPTCTTSPSWLPRSTRLPRPVCSEPSSRPGWAPGWRSPRNRTSSHSHPDSVQHSPNPTAGLGQAWVCGRRPGGRRAGQGGGGVVAVGSGSRSPPASQQQRFPSESSSDCFQSQFTFRN
uniref:Adenosine deaminase RNA specific B1 n=1 Tax=Ovis aries TaxID=9940 RepID=A0AC11DLX4_SHEEP